MTGFVKIHGPRYRFKDGDTRRRVLLSLNKMTYLLGRSRESVLLLEIEDSTFPRHIAFPGRRIAWIESEVKEWIDDQEKRDLGSE